MISIAMTTYNGSKYISEQIKSIQNQTISDFELIICDDCSSDDTVKIINEFQKKDSRISLHCNAHNLGFKKNFEQAVKLCHGDYIALCDQDDVWTDNHLEILLSGIGDNLVISGNNELVDQNLNSLHKDFFSSNLFSLKKYPVPDKILKKILLSGNCFQGASMLLKKEIIPIYLPIPETIKYHDSWLSALACSLNSFTVTNSIVTKYRQHQAQVTAGDKETLDFSKGRFLFCDELLNRLKGKNKTISSIRKFFSNNSKISGRIKNSFFLFKNYNYLYPDSNAIKLPVRFVRYILFS